MSELKYKGYAIVLQEVPNEITLAFNICGCPYHCRGCHSQYLWDNDGKLLREDIDKIINKYSSYLTCVCFMGGDWNSEELAMFEALVKFFGLKTAIYSGSDDEQMLEKLKKMNFDYIKVGSYQDELGGLNSSKTNQRMFKLVNDEYIDITNSFWKEVNANGYNN